jgi:hypothetical protein
LQRLGVIGIYAILIYDLYRKKTWINSCPERYRTEEASSRPSSSALVPFMGPSTL